jgi:hypothetical protein
VRGARAGKTVVAEGEAAAGAAVETGVVGTPLLGSGPTAVPDPISRTAYRYGMNAPIRVLHSLELFS